MEKVIKALENVSMNGRMAYSILCLENYVLQQFPDREWSIIFKKLWPVTGNVYWDEWSRTLSDLLPECLFEFPNYEESDFNSLSSDEYNTVSALTNDLPETWNDLLHDVFDLEEVYAYSSIPGNGTESLEIISDMLQKLQDTKVTWPDPRVVSFSKFSERKGWGNDFDGQSLSAIL